MRTVRRYSVLEPRRSAQAILVDWSVITAGFAASIIWPHPAVWAVSAIVITGRQHALLILMHEGAHFRLHPDRRWNDRLSDWLLAFPFLISTLGYRNHHIAHHVHTNTDDDPDWVRKLADADWDLPKTKVMLARLLLRDFFGGGLLDQLRSVGRLRPATTKDSRPLVRPSTERVAYYGVFAALITGGGLWIPVLLLWFLPAFTLLPVFLRIRSIAEHFALPGETGFDSSRNYPGPWWERAFFTPHNIGYHLDHHLFPSVPFYNLPALHRRLDRSAQYRRIAYQNDSLFNPTACSVLSDVSEGDDEKTNQRKRDTVLNRKRCRGRQALEAASKRSERKSAPGSLAAERGWRMTPVTDSSALKRCPFLRSALGGAPRRGTVKTNAPGPAGLPFIGSMIDYLKNPTAFLSHLAVRYGDLAQFRLGRRVMLQISDPDLIERILNRDYQAFKKTGVLLRTREVLGDGLITSDGDAHKRGRRRAQPAFSSAALKGYAPTVAEAARDAVAGWRHGGTIDLADEMNRLSLIVAGRTLFGSDISQRSGAIADATTLFFEYFNLLLLPFSSWWLKVPTSKNRRYRKALKTIEETVDELIRLSLAERDQSSFLSVFLRGIQQDDDADIDLSKVREEVMTFLMAGHETTATALAWTWYNLGTHPETARRFYDEIDRELGGRAPGAEDIERLTFTGRVIKESMRLYPPVWNLTRETTERYELNGVRLPAGTVVGMSPFVVHRDPRFYESPLAFRPERWTEEETKKRHRYSYFPFGGGPRGCIGAGFAMMEMKLILATLAQRYRFVFDPARSVAFKPFITLRPAAMPVRVEERRERPPAPVSPPMRRPGGTPRRARVLFVGEAVTLSHVARPRVLAGALDPERFEIHFAADPRTAWVAADLAGKFWPLPSISSDTFLGHLAAGRPVYDADTLERYVRDDLRLIETVRPDLIVGDFRLSLSVSARLAGVPYAAISNIHWSPYAHVKFPAPDIPIYRLTPPRIADALFNATRAFAFGLHARPINVVRRRFGLPHLSDDLRAVYTDGDYSLYADPAGWIQTDTLPDSHRILGPIYWTPSMPLDEVLRSIPTHRPVVYVTLGSSGRLEALTPLVAALGKRNVTAVVATAGRTDLKNLPSNVIAKQYLPGVAGLPRVDLAVTNGGSGSTPQALRAAVPVLGITSLMDQDIPMNAVENHGAGIRVRTRHASEAALGHALDRLLNENRFKVGAEILSKPFQGSATEAFRAFVDGVLESTEAGRRR